MTTASKGRILLVDDDRLVLVTLSDGLRQAGYEVIDADNGDDAILQARARRPDLALLDIRMEGKSGFDVAAYLRDQGGVPFMFLSAFTDEATVQQARDLGALAHLGKPLDIDRLLPEVASAFAKVRSGEVAAVAPRLPAANEDPRSQTVAIALGVLMHRHSLDRDHALEKLRRLAQTEGRTMIAEAERVLEAVELLSLPKTV